MFRFFRLRPFLLISLLTVAAGVLLAPIVLPADTRLSTRLLVAWNAGCVVYIVAMSVVMSRASLDQLRRQAQALDGGRVFVLFLALLAAAMSVTAIGVDLASAKTEQGYGMAAIIHAGATIALSWTVTHLLFAVHYAHEFYAPDDGDEPGGLKFPGTAEPAYGDFVHFSFVIGCAAQTADIAISSPAFRRIVTVHCIAAFVFNTLIVALTINIGASLIGGK